MVDCKLLKKAYRIAKEAHEGQFDKAGKPYIFHPITVARNCSNDKAKAVALLHDTLEDQKDKVSYESLVAKVGKEVADAVLLLTNDGNKGTYLEYVKSIKDSDNKLAIEVKRADLKNNMDLSRLAKITANDLNRLDNKYIPALKIIEEK